MKIPVLGLLLANWALCGSAALGQDQPANESVELPQKEASQDPQAESAEIVALSDAYVTAFNAGDAAALASLWSDDGEMQLPSGESINGREALQTAFDSFFQNDKANRLELLDTSVQMLSPHVAVERGVARVTGSDKVTAETEYETIYIKTADGWRIDRSSETEIPTPPPTHYQQLQELEWMIGQWSDEEGNSSLESSCRWTTNQNFIVRSFKVFDADRVDFEGTQIIGWDPLAQTIRSWMFDSDGGFGVGRWTREGDRWSVQTLNVLADGRRASATNIYDLLDEGRMQFQSIGRQVDGELLPNLEPVIVVRTSDQ